VAVTDAVPSPDPEGLDQEEALDPVADAATLLDAPESEPSKLAATITVIEDAEGRLGDVEAALERLESGRYRVCEICGGPLDAAALAATPTLRRCLIHAS
jgi:RNA polymerase-binding transcription factor DksA